MCVLKCVHVYLPDSVSAFECCFRFSVSLNTTLEYIIDILGFVGGSFGLILFDETFGVIREVLCV